MIVEGKYNRMYKEFVARELEEFIGPPDIGEEYRANFIEFYSNSRREMQNYLRSYVFSKVKRLKEVIKNDPDAQEDLDHYYELFQAILKIRGIM